MKAPTTDKHVLSFFIDRSVSAAGSVVVVVFIFCLFFPDWVQEAQS